MIFFADKTFLKIKKIKFEWHKMINENLKKFLFKNKKNLAGPFL